MRASGSGRVAALDALKGASILLVVFNHALLWPMREADLPSAFFYGTAFGTVAAFSAVAGYVRGLRPPASDAALLIRRARQLLVPWAIAAPVYAVAPFLWRLVGGAGLPLGFEPLPWAREILLGGGPLWFLPVLFVAQAVCALFIRRTRSWWPAAGAVIAYVAVALPASLENLSPLALGGGTFWAVAPLYVAAFWFGVRLAEDGRAMTRPARALAIVVVTMLVSGGITLVRAMVPDARWLMWLPYGIGLVGGCAAVVFAVGWRPSAAPSVWAIRSGGWLVRAGRASLRSYLVHPVLLAPVALALSGRGGVPAALAVAVFTVAITTWSAERVLVAARYEVG
ncbi:MAG: acyltransferase [Coriobacteriia bacterium]|nr:acyltransferase [Coriobacteriia bacterium]